MSSELSEDPDPARPRNARATGRSTPEYFVGKEALGKDDPVAARDAFPRVLAERPEQLDAKAGLARADVPARRPRRAGTGGQVLTRALGGTTELLRVTLEELGPAGEARAPPPVPRLARGAAAGRRGDGNGARPYYEVAAARTDWSVSRPGSARWSSTRSPRSRRSRPPPT